VSKLVPLADAEVLFGAGGYCGHASDRVTGRRSAHCPELRRT